MLRLIDKYLRRLHREGLCAPEDALLIALDDEAYSNKEIPQVYIDVFNRMNVNSLLVGIPMEPYRGIIKEVIDCTAPGDKIVPSDCETRTFFHDIPIIEQGSTDLIVSALGRRKALVTKDGMIISYGIVSPEQAYIAFSSLCFSLFVKYLHDNIRMNQKGPIPPTLLGLMSNMVEKRPSQTLIPTLGRSPMDREDVFSLISETGKTIVRLGLVDSFFGNISCLFDNKIYISQTGSSLDELETAIDELPMDGSSTSGITASSECSAHRLIYERTALRFIVHGHPRFAVILSMLCGRQDCWGDSCYRSCKELRRIGPSPVVSGEIGTGTHGLLNTVPEAMREGRVVTVFGHGVFAGSEHSFYDALLQMIELENYCMREYKGMLKPP